MVVMFESHSLFMCHAASRRARSWCLLIQPPNTDAPYARLCLYMMGEGRSVLMTSLYLPKIPDSQESELQ